MYLNLRRLTYLSIIVLPLTTLFLMMLGMVYTQAAIIQKVSAPQATSASPYRQTVSRTLIRPTPRAMIVPQQARKPNQVKPEQPYAWGTIVSTHTPTAKTETALFVLAWVLLVGMMVIRWVRIRSI